MRLVTWNVNGLRTFINYDPFFSFKGAYDKAFDVLEADVICLQELKTPRSSLTKAQAVPLGFDGFLALPQSGKGYSGVGTWTRQAVVVAQAAEEGLLGDLLLSRAPAAATARVVAIGEADDRPQRIGCYPSLDELDLLDSPPTTGEDVGSHSSSSGGGGGGGGGGPFDLGSIDLEGRAILVDLGLFILINVYCPNETSPQRLPFKVNFLRVLEARVRALRSAGREVVVVGDVNVVARPEDHGEGSLASKQETFWNHPARKWFDALLAPKGILHDVVREHHPKRDKMFTCWETRTDARASNYGTRLDYILMTPGLLPWVKHADILPDVRGSDHCPVYVDFYDVLPPTPTPTPRPFAPPSSPSLFSPSRSPFSTPTTSPAAAGAAATVASPTELSLASSSRPTAYTAAAAAAPVVLKDLLNRSLRPSPPDAEGKRTASAPPKACAAFWEGFSEKSIRSYFVPAGGGGGGGGDRAGAASTAAAAAAAAGELHGATGKGKERPSSVATPLPPPPPPPSSAPRSATSAKTGQNELIDLTSSPESSPFKPPPSARSRPVTCSSSGSGMSTGRAPPSQRQIKPLKFETKGKTLGSRSTSTADAPRSGQTKLSAFFKQPPSLPPPAAAAASASRRASAASNDKGKRPTSASAARPSSASSSSAAKRARLSSEAGPSSSSSSSSVRRSAAAEEDENEAADYAFALALAAADGPSPFFGGGDNEGGPLASSSSSSNRSLSASLDGGGRWRGKPSSSASAPAVSAAAAAVDPQATKEVWSQLLKRPPVPRCAIHGVPCIERTVTKPGPNKGKLFYLCSLPLGPGHDSGGQKTGRLRAEVDQRFKCDFFCWASALRVEGEDRRLLAKGLDLDLDPADDDDEGGGRRAG